MTTTMLARDPVQPVSPSDAGLGGRSMHNPRHWLHFPLVEASNA